MEVRRLPAGYRFRRMRQRDLTPEEETLLGEACIRLQEIFALADNEKLNHRRLCRRLEEEGKNGNQGQ
jgi:hypothetical protein